MVEIKRDKCLIIIHNVGQLKPAQLRKILKLASVWSDENDKNEIKSGCLKMIRNEIDGYEKELDRKDYFRPDEKSIKRKINALLKLKGVVDQWDI